MSTLKKQAILMVDYKTLKKIFSQKNNIDYSKIGLRLNQKIALNKLMYSDYKVVKKPYTLYVNKDTYNSKKSVIVDYVIEDIIIKYKQMGRSDRTIIARIDSIVEFLRWSHIEHFNFLENIDNAKKAFHIFTNYLKLRIRDGSYAAGTASVLQSAALKMLKAIHFDTENIIASGIKTIHRGKFKRTEKSSDEDRVYQFNFYTKLFNGISDFVLNNKKYPYKLNLHRKDIWIIPQRPIFLAGHGTYYNKIFDHTTGKIRSNDKIYELFDFKNTAVSNAERKSFLRRLRHNNKDMRTKERLILATVALKAYYMTFIAVTGMNDSTAATLLWADEYLVKKEQHKFRNIKYRANGKIVEFELEKRFVTSFQKFIKLREFILDGYDFKYLFFVDYGENANMSIIQQRGNFVKTINSYMIKKIDPSLPHINAKEMRVNKTHIVIEKSGLVSASLSAQSSIGTIRDHYTGESSESSSIQMTNFYAHFNETTICDKDEGISISIGQCLSIDNPTTEIEIKGISTDCKQAEGCLFCNHYACHADAIDIRKLHSLKFIIEETRCIAKDEKHFLSVYKKVLDRIDDILSTIENLSVDMKSLVNTIYKDVFENENLSSYWDYKLTSLINMGVLK